MSKVHHFVNIGQNAQRAIAYAIAESFQICHLLKRETATLSGGEKQRVALASVMVRKPSVLLLDEPDSFLDVVGRKMLDEQLQKLRYENEKLTIVRVTQFKSVAKGYDRLVLFEKGRVKADSSPKELLGKHFISGPCRE